MRFVGPCSGLWISMMIAATSLMAAPTPGVSVAEVDGSAFAPLLYQSSYIGNDSRFYIGLWARQTGKSTGVAVKKIDKAMRYEAEGRKYFCMLASAGERQSRELFEKFLTFVEAARLAGVELGERYLDDVKSTALTVTFPGGSRIIAVPSNPRTVRGFSGDVVLDEFAFHEDQDGIFAAVLPTITRNTEFQIDVLSTANGCLNRFYQIWTGGGPDPGGGDKSSDVWSRQKVTLPDAVSQGLDVDVETLRAGINDETIWQQECLCEFVDEATAWLTWDRIRACESVEATT